MEENKYLVAGINEQKMNKAIINIYNIAEAMQEKFNSVEALMADASEDFKSPGMSNLLDNFNSFKTNFATAVANIRCYGEDLTKVKNNFRNINMNIAENIKKEGKV